MPPSTLALVSWQVVGRFLTQAATYAVRVQNWRHRGTVGPVVVTGGALLTLIASFLGWVRSGTVHRSSYEILGLVHRLGFAPNGWTRTFIRLWPIMPLLLAVAVVAAWWGWRWVAAIVGIAGGAYATALGLVVASAVPESSEVGVSAAPLLTAIGGMTVIVGSLLCGLLRVPSDHAHSR